MQINDPATAREDLADDELLPREAEAASRDQDADELTPGKSRRRSPRRGPTERISPRFTPDDRREIDTAAASAGMSASRFCAEAALAAARGAQTVLTAAQGREALARLQRQLFAARSQVARFGTNVNQAVAKLHTTGKLPPELVPAVELAKRSVLRLDELTGVLDRRLR